MGCFQNYGPILVLGYITAPNVFGVPKRDPNFGNYPYRDSIGVLHGQIQG